MKNINLKAYLAVAAILFNISFLFLYTVSKISVVEYIESNKKQTQKNCCMFKEKNHKMKEEVHHLL